jgi:hypothetical protein
MDGTSVSNAVLLIKTILRLVPVAGVHIIELSLTEQSPGQADKYEDKSLKKEDRLHNLWSFFVKRRLF